MRCAFVAFTLVLFAPLSQAAEFFLKDGSVVIGSIVRLADGEDLVVDTEHMDEVTIEWDAVESIRGAQVVDVELFDGRRLLGAVIFDEDGNVQVRGTEEFEVDPAEIFSIDEVNDTFWDALEARVDLGMNLVRGNNQVTQFSFGGRIGYDARNFETGVDVSSILNEQINADNTRRFTLGANYTQKLRRNWQVTGLYTFESDEQQNLQGRSLLGVALGKRLINNRRQRFELYAGAALNAEQFTDSPQSESVEGLLGTTYRRRAFADIDASFTVLPNLEQSGRVRTLFDASLSFDLFKDLDIKLTVYDRYDSDPPQENENHDSGMTLGVSYEY